MDGTQGNEQDLVLTPEQIAADMAADDDFLAAFNNAHSDTLDTEGTTGSSTQADAAAVAPEPVEQASAPAATEAPPETTTVDEDDAPVVITRRQLAELTGVGATVAALQAEMRRSMDSTNGRIGSIQQTLKDVREQASKGLRPSFDQMEALENDFPELADSIKRDLGKIFGKGNETQPETTGTTEGDGITDVASGADAPGVAPAVNPLETPEVRQALRQAHLAIVDARHEGWRSFPATPEWQSWQEQLPPTARELLRTTSDAETLSEALNDFKGWKQKHAAATTATNQRGKRLENAIPATTGSTAPVRSTQTDDEAFEAGFKQARR